MCLDLVFKFWKNLSQKHSLKHLLAQIVNLPFIFANLFGGPFFILWYFNGYLQLSLFIFIWKFRKIFNIVLWQLIIIKIGLRIPTSVVFGMALLKVGITLNKVGIVLLMVVTALMQPSFTKSRLPATLCTYIFSQVDSNDKLHISYFFKIEIDSALLSFNCNNLFILLDTLYLCHIQSLEHLHLIIRLSLEVENIGTCGKLGFAEWLHYSLIFISQLIQ